VALPYRPEVGRNLQLDDQRDRPGDEKRTAEFEAIAYGDGEIV